MKNKYDHIQRLIDHWREFEEQNHEKGLDAFGQWLADKLHTSKPNRDPVQEKEASSAGRMQQFFGLISRISRLQDFYIKKLFEGLPLNNYLEFNYLFYINKHTSPKKKEIIDHHLTEYTTGIDIIKRLIRLGLVHEFSDQLDKRSKRLKITADGKKALVEALITLKRIENIFFEGIIGYNWEGCLPVLTALEKYHASVFARGASGTGYDIFQIIEQMETDNTVRNISKKREERNE